MSFFSGSKGSTAPAYTGLQLQTSVSTLPVTVIWGRTRVAPNVIWSDGFQSHQQKASGGGKGLGGGGSGKGGSGEYTYSAWVMLAVGEGTITGIPRIWVDAKTVYTDTIYHTALSQAGLTLLSGADGQGVWGSVGPGTQYAYAGLVYPNVAYLAAANYNLGDSASIPNHTFEVVGNLAGTSPNGIDADPALVIQDFLTNARYGIPAFPSSSIDTGTLLSSASATTTGDAAYQTYCKALGLGLSPCLDSTETASSLLDRLLQLTNSTAVWSGGQLKIIPYGDEAVTGNGVTYLPNTTPIYDLDDDDFVATGGKSDPVEIARTDVYDAYNVQRLEIYDRANQYKTTTIEARDQNSIEQIGLRVASTITAHEICDAGTIAPLAAQLILQRGLYVRNTISFTLSWEYCLLEPMDLVTVTDAGLGLSKAVYRILSVEEDDQGMLAVTAEEYPPGHATATLYPKQTTSATLPNYGVAPGSVNPPAIFEPAASLTTNGLPELWIVASGGAQWGGCAVYVSVDNVTYVQVGTINVQGRQGVLTAALPTASDPDTTDTLSVDFSESGASLISGTQADADAGRTLLLIDGELVAFTTATLTGPNIYNFGTYLRRGQYGTAIAAHAAGAPAARLDGTVFRYTLPAAYQGQTLWIKLPSFNIYGQGQENLADVTAYEHLINGTAMTVGAPSGLTISSTSNTQGDGTTILSMVFSWDPSAGPLLGGYELEWMVGGGDWQSVTLDANTTSWKLSPARADSNYGARVRAVSQTGYSSAWDTIGSPVNSGALLTSVPAAPSGLATIVGQGSVTISWTAPTDPSVLYARVFYTNGTDTNFADATLIAAQVMGTSFTWTGLGFGNSYEFWVEFVNAAGASSPAGPVAATTSYTVPIGALTSLAGDGNIALFQQNVDAIPQMVAALGAYITSEQTTRSNETSSLSSSVATISSGLAGMSASVSTVTSTLASLSGSASATWGVYLVAQADGSKAIAGIQASADLSGSTAVSELVFEASAVKFVVPNGSSISLATPFEIVQLDSGGTIVTSGGTPTCVMQALYVGTVNANQIKGGTITGQSIIVQPSGGVGGLTVYDVNGDTVIDSTHGVYPGAVSSLPIATGGAYTPTTAGWMTVCTLTLGSASGHVGLLLMMAYADDAQYDGTYQPYNAQILCDGTQIWSGTGVSRSTLSAAIPITGAQIAAGAHALTLQIQSQSGAGSTSIVSSQLSFYDFKA